MANTKTTPAHDDIADALRRDSSSPHWRERRREESIAATFEHDEGSEQMIKQLREDPDRFDRTYGPRGRMKVGMYEQAKRAALGPDSDDPEAAA